MVLWVLQPSILSDSSSETVANYKAALCHSPEYDNLQQIRGRTPDRNIPYVYVFPFQIISVACALKPRQAYK